MGPKSLVRASVAAVAVLSCGLLFVALLPHPSITATPLRAKDNASPAVVPEEEGWTLAVWDNLPVLLLVVPEERLAGVESARGEGSATPSIPWGTGLRLMAFSAKSTHLGCTVGFNANLGASRDIADYDGDGVNDGRIMDPCSQSTWDPYHNAKPVQGPAPTRLASLDVQVRDGELVATGYDGPVGRAR